MPRQTLPMGPSDPEPSLAPWLSPVLKPVMMSPLWQTFLERPSEPADETLFNCGVFLKEKQNKPEARLQRIKTHTQQGAVGMKVVPKKGALGAPPAGHSGDHPHPHRGHL